MVIFLNFFRKAVEQGADLVECDLGNQRNYLLNLFFPNKNVFLTWIMKIYTNLVFSRKYNFSCGNISPTWAKSNLQYGGSMETLKVEVLGSNLTYVTLFLGRCTFAQSTKTWRHFTTKFILWKHIIKIHFMNFIIRLLKICYQKVSWFKNNLI